MDHYEYLTKSQWNKEISHFDVLISNFIEESGYSLDDIGVFETVVLQIITKVDQRKKYFQFFHHLDISDFKELALYCFWIIKLKPLFLIKKDATDDDKLAFESINEKLALYKIINKFKSLSKDDLQRQRIDDFFTMEYMYELIYSFTYRDISKEALTLLIETIANALGFVPYQKCKGTGSQNN